MDPNACLRELNDCTHNERAAMREHAENLRTWIARGGFQPDWNAYPKGTKRYQRLMGLGDDLRA